LLPGVLEDLAFGLVGFQGLNPNAAVGAFTKSVSCSVSFMKDRLLSFTFCRFSILK